METGTDWGGDGSRDGLEIKDRSRDGLEIKDRSRDRSRDGVETGVEME